MKRTEDLRETSPETPAGGEKRVYVSCIVHCIADTYTPSGMKVPTGSPRACLSAAF